jgi:capsular polysaccharide biosynthesis protein
MDLMSLVRLMVRHWRVTAPAAAVTLMLVAAAFLLASPTYVASASVALFSPPEYPEVAENPGATTSSAETPDTTTSSGENPFTRYGDLAVVADIVARKMNSDAERAALESEGVTGYEVVANRLQRGPIVEVTGNGPNAADAINSAEAVVARFDAVLSEMQEAEGADPAFFITSGAVEPPETAVAQVGSTVRTAIAALAVGALGTLGLAVAAEAFIRRRAGVGGAPTLLASTPGVAAGPASEPAEDQPTSSEASRAAATLREPADDRPRQRSVAGRSASKASGQADDRPNRSSGRGRSAEKSGDADAPARGDAPNGSRRRAPRIASVPAADHGEAKQSDWNRWVPSAGAFAPDNGYKKPTTDRSK